MTQREPTATTTERENQIFKSCWRQIIGQLFPAWLRLAQHKEQSSGLPGNQHQVLQHHYLSSRYSLSANSDFIFLVNFSNFNNFQQF